MGNEKEPGFFSFGAFEGVERHFDKFIFVLLPALFYYRFTPLPHDLLSSLRRLCPPAPPSSCLPSMTAILLCHALVLPCATLLSDILSVHYVSLLPNHRGPKRRLLLTWHSVFWYPLDFSRLYCVRTNRSKSDRSIHTVAGYCLQSK